MSLLSSMEGVHGHSGKTSLCSVLALSSTYSGLPWIMPDFIARNPVPIFPRRFGRAVMDAMAEWTAELAAREASKAPAHVSPGGYPARDLAAESSGAGKEEEGGTSGNPSEGTNGRRALGGGSSSGATEQGASSVLEMRQPLAVYPKRTTCGSAVRWKVLDIGTGNGLLLHALAKHG